LARPTTDLALVLRYKVWALAVKQTCNMSWEGLDDHLAPECARTAQGERTRLFWNVYYWGRDPTKIRRGPIRVNLVKRVRRRFGSVGPMEIWFSRLWRMLSPPGIAPSEWRPISRKIIHRGCLFQAEPEDVFDGHWVLPNEDAFRCDDETRDQGIYNLVRSRGLEGVALLVAQFKLAMAAVELDDAKAYLLGLHDAIDKFCRHWCAGYPEVSIPFRQIVKQRLVLSDWSSPIETDFQMRVRRRDPHSKPARAIHLMESSRLGKALIDIFHHRPNRNPPIVSENESLRWFVRNRELIANDHAIHEASSDLAVFPSDKDRRKRLADMRKKLPRAPYNEVRGLKRPKLPERTGASLYLPKKVIDASALLTEASLRKRRTLERRHKPKKKPEK